MEPTHLLRDDVVAAVRGSSLSLARRRRILPRRERPAETTRSEHWLRVAVNKATDHLDARVAEAFRWSPRDMIRWLSPRGDDQFAEYYDQAFLDRLGLSDLRVPLRDFWPTGGPRWDGLAHTETGKVILVEAKAHIEEMVDFRSGASGESLTQIERSLQQAKTACGAAVDAPWTAPLYQLANRLAHLHFLHRLNGVDAYLLLLSFADAPDVPAPCSVEQWEGAHRLSKKCLGLGVNSFFGRIGHVVWRVPDMLANTPLNPSAGATGAAAG